MALSSTMMDDYRRIPLNQHQQQQSSSQSSNLFASSHLPLPHLPPIHHSTHHLPRFNPSLPSNAPFADPQWQHLPQQQHRTTRDDLAASTSRPARPRLDHLRSNSYQDTSRQHIPSSSAVSNPPPSATSLTNPINHLEESMPPTSDFVKKLFKMLEDQTFQSVVSWGPDGDCFVVKDMNEFTKSILPKMFKHSNFASFVRQLNKYDFHKVKNAEGTPGGEHAWTFKHPDFHAQRKDALENIKRKVPSQRKSQSGLPAGLTPISSAGENYVSREEYDLVSDRVDELSGRLNEVEQAYQSVLSEMVNFQRNMAQQDHLMQNLIQYFLHFENGKVNSPSHPQPPVRTSPSLQHPLPSASSTASSVFMPHAESSRLLNGREAGLSEEEIARASLEQMNEISRRAHDAGFTFQYNPNEHMGGMPNGNMASGSNVKLEAPNGVTVPIVPQNAAGLKDDLTSRRLALQSLSEEFQRSRTPQTSSSQGIGSNGTASDRNASHHGSSDFDMFQRTDPNKQHDSSSNSPPSHAGLQVFTVGHLMPREDGWGFDGVADQTHAQQHQQHQTTDDAHDYSYDGDGPQSSSDAAGIDGDKHRLRVRRSTFVPAWAVPPRVLLVDDDAVSRRLSSKFLQVSGCTIDVAVDGESAVTKMNLEKYDLVLMDIVMPKLDGVSATSLIRKFDPRTPIISMTSNSKPNDILYYFSHGMNDILPKPFTKEGLMGMLDKHLMHLKAIEALRKVPRGVGIPPLSDENFDQALLAASQGQLTHPGSHQALVGPNTNDDQEGTVNPFAGMGMSDEQYALLLQNIVGSTAPNGTTSGVNNHAGHQDGLPLVDLGLGLGSFAFIEKRPLEDVDERVGGKRGRFEVVE